MDFITCIDWQMTKKQRRAVILFLAWRKWWGSGQMPCMVRFSAHCPCHPSAVLKWECVWRPSTAKSGLRAGAVTSTVLFSFITLSMIRKKWSHFPESSLCQRSVMSTCGSVIRPLILGEAVGTELYPDSLLALITTSVAIPLWFSFFSTSQSNMGFFFFFQITLIIYWNDGGPEDLTSAQPHAAIGSISSSMSPF